MRNSIGAVLIFCAVFTTFRLTGQVHKTSKSLTVNRLKSAILDPKDIPLLFNNAAIPYQFIDQLNWTTYPYKPKVSFAIAYTEKALLIHYKVEEQHVRAVTNQDNGKVFQDACVEFFVQPQASDLTYYNFEFNCIGKLLMQAGKPGKRALATEPVLNSIKRWSSLGKDPIDIPNQITSWQLAVMIPLTAFYLTPMDSLADQKFKGNFYKCGDKLEQPHYLSWSPIHLPHPQFHAIDFFGNINFQ
ncbi:carbohydrate-binding family 9-like protein [Sphingobacterium anhuiense]|uniref:Carbohydrate-binding family 9-like protein n=1 Tax=Sphingobacterium anhuiense TaxID=493780 RepID=A0ABW5YUJ6_9SPHI